MSELRGKCHEKSVEFKNEAEFWGETTLLIWAKYIMSFWGNSCNSYGVLSHFLQLS